MSQFPVELYFLSSVSEPKPTSSSVSGSKPGLGYSSPAYTNYKSNKECQQKCTGIQLFPNSNPTQTQKSNNNQNAKSKATTFSISQDGSAKGKACRLRKGKAIAISYCGNASHVTKGKATTVPQDGNASQHANGKACTNTATSAATRSTTEATTSFVHQHVATFFVVVPNNASSQPAPLQDAPKTVLRQKLTIRRPWK
ncbi:hypothetical protein RIF29_39439 [Crotalaria pallida]|uniref:Uncharacterized protein n=1 Tax=Crotalaria pallida TaxID=3830 RepID=A0AAN9E6L3_CROPI